MAAVLGAGVLWAGDGPDRPRVPHFEARASLVVLSATAVDRRGRPVRDLTARELQVYEDGRLQELVHFAHARESGARILVLVDASGSMNARRKTADARMAATQLLAALDSGDEVALAGFDDRYFGVVGFTRDRQAIRNGFAELTPFGATALHDALDVAAQDLASHGEGRRAVVVVTDGVDTASSNRAEDVMARSRALDVPIYALSVVSPLDDPRSPLFAGRERTAAATEGGRVLEGYARMSGGASFVTSDFGGLLAAARAIVGEVKHQYRLGYHPPPGPPAYRRVEVRSTRKGLVVRTRSGYLPR